MSHENSNIPTMTPAELLASDKYAVVCYVNGEFGWIVRGCRDIREANEEMRLRKWANGNSYDCGIVRIDRTRSDTPDASIAARLIERKAARVSEEAETSFNFGMSCGLQYALGALGVSD